MAGSTILVGDTAMNQAANNTKPRDAILHEMRRLKKRMKRLIRRYEKSLDQKEPIKSSHHLPTPGTIDDSPSPVANLDATLEIVNHRSTTDLPKRDRGEHTSINNAEKLKSPAVAETPLNDQYSLRKRRRGVDYNTSYHPLDDVVPQIAIAQKRRSSSNTESSCSSADTGQDPSSSTLSLSVQSASLSFPAIGPLTTRRSSRKEAQKKVDYSTKHHPQDHALPFYNTQSRRVLRNGLQRVEPLTDLRRATTSLNASLESILNDESHADGGAGASIENALTVDNMIDGSNSSSKSPVLEPKSLNLSDVQEALKRESSVSDANEPCGFDAYLFRNFSPINRDTPDTMDIDQALSGWKVSCEPEDSIFSLSHLETENPV